MTAGRARLGDDFDAAWGQGSKMGFVEAVDAGRAVLAARRVGSEVGVA